MNIQKITFTSGYIRNNKTDKSTDNSRTYPQMKEYNPHSYMDYNITFGQRLFRTPANFYAQDFNRKGMPKTMKDYLDENYVDRQHIPPAQMMKIVFEDINTAETLEQVKELYPDEPLFQNLHSMKKHHREGILAEISVMKDSEKPLFKNGKNDLGLYILKKIYIEGKTLKEINKDFKKDISKYYQGSSEIQYRDLANLGIKYPQRSFWRSFYSTREDFPYVPLKRKDAQYHAKTNNKKATSIEDINNGNFKPKEKPKYNPSEEEINRMAGAIINGHGNKSDTEKELKKKFRADDPKIQFINQYMSEIMSITLDRVHASQEMRTFFENYNSLSKSEKSRMQRYWDETPEMKALQGLVMSDTIKLFFNTYGANGNNEEFKNLVEYAHSIKPERELQLQRHNEVQKEYEEMFSHYPEKTEVSIVKDEDLKTNTEVQNVKEEINKSTYIDTTGMKEYVLVGENKSKLPIKVNIEEGLKTFVNSQIGYFFPESFVKKYYNFIIKHPSATDKFKIGLIIRSSSISELFEEKINNKYILSNEEELKIINKINGDFVNKYSIESAALVECMVKTLSYKEKNGNIEPARLYSLDALSSVSMFAEIKKKSEELGIHTNIIDKLRETIDSEYKKYLTPPDTDEASKISEEINKYMSMYEPKYLPGNNYTEKENDFSTLLSALAIGLSECKPKEKRQFYTGLTNFIQKEYGGTAKSVLDPELSQATHIAKIEHILLKYINSNTNKYTSIVTQSQRAMFNLYINAYLKP